jgi:lysozyme
MKASQNCVNLIKSFEGYSAKAYKCPANVVTIGWGSTMYQDGSKIKMGDTVTEEEAEKLLMWELDKKSIGLHGLKLNQNQADSLLSFIFNLGIGAFKKSTLYRKINLNPWDSTIRAEFLKWNKARVGGKLIELRGLTRRRDAEANLYFS